MSKTHDVPHDTHDEIAAEQVQLDRMYARLDTVRAETQARLARALLAGTVDTPQGLRERDALVTLYEQRVTALEGVDEHLCFGRLDRRDGSRIYIGRVGLADEDNQPMLIDWRAPVAAAFYQATAAAPGDVVRRRHLSTRERRVLAVEDEVLDLAALDDGQRRRLVGEGALLVAVQAARTGRMGDIVATIQAEQDQVIRAHARGVLVVQGGPGTGKTVVSLHRAAFLLFTHREQLARSGVLLVGPSPVFLRYIERVLPSLGETGVIMRTPGTLYPGVKTDLEEAPAAARIKGGLAMVDVLVRAVQQRQRMPAAPVDLDVDGKTITVTPEAFTAARRQALAGRKLHNTARPIFIRHLVGHLVELLADPLEPGEEITVEERADMLDDLLAAPDVRRLLRTLWPPLTPERLLAELFGNPKRLAAAAPNLDAADRALLVRAPEAADCWTLSDVPLLDEAAEILGKDDSAEQRAARRAAEQRRADLDYAREVLKITGAGASGLVSAAALADRFSDSGPIRTVAERAERDRTWAFGHIVVDEAQELSPMAWRLLMRRCPSRSMTLVGDIAQTGAAAGAESWAGVLTPYVRDRWRLAELTLNYRTPAAVMDVATAMLRAAGISASTPESVRAGDAPVACRLAMSDVDALVALVRAEQAALGDRRMALIAPPDGPWSAALLAEALAAGLPDGIVGQGAAALDAPVAVLQPRQSKGLEVDVVVLVEPADILTASPRGANDLYVAMTRPTQRLLVVHSRDLPAGMDGIAPAQAVAPEPHSSPA